MAETLRWRDAAVSETPEVLTWNRFDEAVWDLAERIAVDGVPDMNLCIARGGLVIGGALG